MSDVVLYDGHCRICTTGARRLAALAAPGTVELRDFQSPGVLAAFPQLTHEQCMQAMQLVTPDGRVFSGAEAAVRALFSRPILGWPARLYYLPGVRQASDAAYAWVARNRYRLSGGPVCDDAGCALHRPPAGVESAHPMRVQRLLVFAIAAFLLAGTAYWIWKPLGRTAEDRLRDDDDLAGLHRVRNAFLKGDWKEGFALLEPYKKRTYPNGPVGSLAQEVDRIVIRVTTALNKAKGSGELYDAGQHEQAAKLMAEAAREYPENAQLQFSADYYEGTVAFERKDYDLYLRLAEDNTHRNPAGPTVALWLANARATKYALSGKPEDKTSATEALQRAEELAKSALGGAHNDDMTKTFDRIRYRLETRQIVDAAEYDRRMAHPQSGK